MRFSPPDVLSDMTRPSIGVIVVAAGSGTRLGAGAPKAFVTVGDRTILEHALRSVFGMHAEASIVVVVPGELRETAAELSSREAPADRSIVVAAGGSSRQASVAAGLAALPAEVETVLVHDAARALTPSAIFDAVARRVHASSAGVVPALPVSDTIKTADAAGRVIGTLERSELVAVQTPQGFPRAALVDAYARAESEYTDDAAVFAASGGEVSVIPGDALSFKITTPADLRRAEALVTEEASSAGEFRVGAGVDVHAYDEAAPLWLGTLFWPDEPGLAGHSDGDAISHAICDSLLSAAGLGDIGSRFGTDDPRFAGAHGEVFLTATVDLLRDAGWRIGNVSVQVIARRPRMAARREEVQRALEEIIGAPVSVSATTTDGLGFTGRGEGVAALSTALVRPLGRRALGRPALGRPALGTPALGRLAP